jgi:hypothetical protein
MGAGTIEIQKGALATGRHPMIGVRVPKDDIAHLDKWAKAKG